MVTRIRPRRPIHLYITEHREAKGLSVEQVAGRIVLYDINGEVEKEGVSRETVWRWENEQRRLNPEKTGALAYAIGIEPEEFYRPPERPSLDALVKHAPDDLVQTAHDIVRRLAQSA